MIAAWESGSTEPCDILIRSYWRDFEWLGYCLASVARFTVGFRQVIVVVPRSSRAYLSRLRLPALDVDLRFCADHRDDYLGQQVTKLHADELTDAALICHLDADSVLTRTVTPGDLTVDGRARVVGRRIETLGRNRPWQGPTERFLGWPVRFDFMWHPPFAYPRWLYGAVRRHAVEVHGRDLAAYVLDQPPRGFSEFNVLGAFAWERHRDAFAWVGPEDAPTPVCRWYWSWGGLRPEIRYEIEALLVR